MSQSGRDFELAVYKFAEALDPDAKVRFNHKVRDRDNKRMRQVDVWIDTKCCGHWPISILVSCKELNRKLNSAHIGTFVNEVWSYGASTGVIYSSSGFTGPALAKANANGLACCRLYRDEPADIPEILFLPAYVCVPKLSLSLTYTVDLKGPTIWNDLFDIPVGSPGQDKLLIDVLMQDYHREEAARIRTSKGQSGFPEAWIRCYTFSDAPDGEGRIGIEVKGWWKIYRGRREAHLVNGSYCYKDDSFWGRQQFPSVDLWSAHPGEGWEEVIGPVEDLPRGLLLMVLSGGDFKKAARKKLGPKPIRPQSA